MTYPTSISLCDGKYEVIYDFSTGQSECLRHGEKWRDLCGDKMVLAMFDRIVELEELLTSTKNRLAITADMGDGSQCRSVMNRLAEQIQEVLK